MGTEITLEGIILWFAMMYFATAFIWGIYAVSQQKKYYWATTTSIKYFSVFIINMVFTPVCILIAIRKDPHLG